MLQTPKSLELAFAFASGKSGVGVLHDFYFGVARLDFVSFGILGAIVHYNDFIGICFVFTK